MSQQEREDSRKERILEVNKVLDRKASAFQEMDSTPNGSLVFKTLREEFDPAVLCTGSQGDVIVRAAQRDVIRYIDLMIQRRKTNE